MVLTFDAHAPVYENTWYQTTAPTLQTGGRVRMMTGMKVRNRERLLESEQRHVPEPHGFALNQIV